MRLCALMMTLCLMLSACGQSTTVDNAAEKISSFYGELTACAAKIQVEADYGDRVAQFTLDCAMDGEGTVTVEVLAPESIAGISARIAKGETSLSFDDVLLETGSFGDLRLSPMGMLPLLMADWRENFPTSFEKSTYQERDCLALTYSTTVEHSTVEHRTFFDGETYLPLHSELSLEGSRILQADFETFTAE